jgi:hypothetical protein
MDAIEPDCMELFASIRAHSRIVFFASSFAPLVAFAAHFAYARMSRITWPPTSVRRKSRPL